MNPTAMLDAPAALDLDTLARRIESEHRAALRCAATSLEHARQVGCYLLAAKRQAGHGGYLPWLERSVSFDRYRAAEYVRVAERWPEIQAQMCDRRTFGLRAALRYLAEPWETPGGEEEELTPSAAKALVAEAWASLPAEQRQELTDETEARLEEEAVVAGQRRAADARDALLDYYARAIGRLRKRQAKLDSISREAVRQMLLDLVAGLGAAPAA